MKPTERKLCKTHEYLPTDIVISPITCWVCEYFDYWHKKKLEKKWYQFWK